MSIMRKGKMETITTPAYLATAELADGKKINVAINRVYRSWAKPGDEKKFTTDCWNASDITTGAAIIPGYNPPTRKATLERVNEFFKTREITAEQYQKAMQKFIDQYQKA